MHFNGLECQRKLKAYLPQNNRHVLAVNIFLNRKPKAPVKYFEVENNADCRKHRRRFSTIRRKKIGTRRKKAARNKNPCTFPIYYSRQFS